MTDTACATPLNELVESALEKMATGEWRMLLYHPDPPMGSSSCGTDVPKEIARRATMSDVQQENVCATLADAEPVAWRVRDFADGWILCPTEQATRTYTSSGHLGEPLYSADTVKSLASALRTAEGDCATLADEIEKAMNWALPFGAAGSWRVSYDKLGTDPSEWPHGFLTSEDGIPLGLSPPVLEYIALCSPANIKTLISALRTAERDRDEARAANERDRSEIITHVNNVTDAVSRRAWIADGRGPYEWDDDKYREEFGFAMAEIREAVQPLRAIGGNLENCPADQNAVRKARNDPRIAALEAENARLRKTVEDLMFLAEAEHVCLLSWNKVGSAANYDGIMDRARQELGGDNG